jgi:hypothetical protein
MQFDKSIGLAHAHAAQAATASASATPRAVHAHEASEGAQGDGSPLGPPTHGASATILVPKSEVSVVSGATRAAVAMFVGSTHAPDALPSAVARESRETGT